ncbi:MAG: response regulator transcription factor [Spirochaetes bacterium]|nr:response regulator transcription factor [Spirochaetota bacterium]
MYSEEESVQYFLSKIRKKILTIPVILLLRTSQEEMVDFEWFFDDFILFPFRKGELEMRVAKLLKNSDVNDDFMIQIGQLTINLKEYSVSKDNEKIDFTYKEFELLRFMIENSGQTFSRKDLLNKIWGVEYIGGTRTVDVHIRRLRSKLGEDFNSFIETVRNVGYRCIDLNKK